MRVLIPGAMLATLVLAGCAHLERPAPAPAAPAETASAATPESEPVQPAAPPAAAASAPPCLPETLSKQETDATSEAKPRPKPARHNAKANPKPAPAQIPMAPVVDQAPVGGVVNAEVKPMPVAVMSILGKRVQGPKGEDMGRVVDVLADASGRVRVAIIDFGGFLGVGDRRIAIDWPLLRFGPEERDPSLILSVSREKLQTAPEYKANARPQTLMEPASTAPSAADTKR